MPDFTYEESPIETDRINRIDKDGNSQFVASCRNNYYVKLFLATLGLTEKDLCELLVLVNEQGQDWKPLFDKINALLCDRAQKWSE